jgi:hypothetical protein
MRGLKRGAKSWAPGRNGDYFFFLLRLLLKFLGSQCGTCFTSQFRQHGFLLTGRFVYPWA